MRDSGAEIADTGGLHGAAPDVQPVRIERISHTALLPPRQAVRVPSMICSCITLLPVIVIGVKYDRSIEIKSQYF